MKGYTMKMALLAGASLALATAAHAGTAEGAPAKLDGLSKPAMAGAQMSKDGKEGGKNQASAPIGGRGLVAKGADNDNTGGGKGPKDKLTGTSSGLAMSKNENVGGGKGPKDKRNARAMPSMGGADTMRQSQGR